MKLKTILIIILVGLIGFSACSKYEEGPFMSLSSSEKRIEGDYTVQAYYEDNTLIPLIDIGIVEYRFVYNEDGTGKTYITSGNNTTESDFEWELDEKKENIRERVLGLNDEWSAWSNYKEIRRLTKTEFWHIDDNLQEFHLIEQ